jgi:hypothetical protein
MLESNELFRAELDVLSSHIAAVRICAVGAVTILAVYVFGRHSSDLRGYAILFALGIAGVVAELVDAQRYSTLAKRARQQSRAQQAKGETGKESDQENQSKNEEGGNFPGGM